jgi:4-amino-4-deoxy-L-arabinose transferase-like glycosyltransferase
MSALRPSNRSPLRVTGWLVVAALIAFRLLPGLVRPGMFFDGVTHAAIARNMAVGTGDFWHPVFSPSDGPGYHEQPPLGFWLESLLFRTLGDHFWVEKIFSGLTGLATAAIIAVIWRRLAGERDDVRNCDWLPVALWATLPGWGWMYGNNMLENTLGLFTALAVYAILRATDGRRAELAWLAAGAAAIAAAVLSKGPVGLFPLAAPLAIHFTLRRQSRVRSMAQTAALAALVAGAGGLILLMPGAGDYLGRYLHEQLFASLEGRREVVASALGRFDIVWKIIRELIVPGFAAFGLIFVARRLGVGRCEENRADSRAIAFCLLTAASASLPIIASPKQSGHYAFPSYVFCALAIALWCAPAVIHLLTKAGDAAIVRRHRLLRFASAIVLIALGAASYAFAGRPQRDNVYQDTIALGRVLPRASVVGLSNELSSDYPLLTNLARWDFIGADRAPVGHEFLVAPLTSASTSGYVEVPTQLSRYRLFKRTAVAQEAANRAHTSPKR